MSGGIASNLSCTTRGFNERIRVSLTRPGSVSSLRLMTSTSRLGYLALILSLVTGCDERAAREDVTLPIPEDSYVGVMAELARVRRRPPPARGQLERDRLADSVRTEVLERHGVTAVEIVEFADAVGADPGRMQDIAERIEALADSLEAGSVQPDSSRADSVVIRASEDSAEEPGADPETRFGNPDLAPPADSSVQVESPTAADTAGEIEPAPEMDSAAPRPRPSNDGPLRRRPPKPAAPDSTNEQSNDGVKRDQTGAV